MIEFESITTRGGDTGQTSIADGSRLSKDDILIDVIGDVDELHAALGMIKSILPTQQAKDEIEWIEQRMLRIGGMLAVPPSHSYYNKIARIEQEDIDTVESWQQEMMKGITMPKAFITYGTTDCGARIDMARAICRRTERKLVTIIRQRAMNDMCPAQVFINRLSDYLFVMARYYESD